MTSEFHPPRHCPFVIRHSEIRHLALRIFGTLLQEMPLGCNVAAARIKDRTVPAAAASLLILITEQQDLQVAWIGGLASSPRRTEIDRVADSSDNPRRNISSRPSAK